MSKQIDDLFKIMSSLESRITALEYISNEHSQQINEIVDVMYIKRDLFTKIIELLEGKTH